MIKGSTHQEDRAILKVCAPNRTGKYVKQKLIKLNGKIDKLTVIVEASTLLSQQLIELDENQQEDRINTITQQDLINIYITLANNSRIHILLSAQRTYAKTNHILGHRNLKINESKNWFFEKSTKLTNL